MYMSSTREINVRVELELVEFDIVPVARVPFEGPGGIDETVVCRACGETVGSAEPRPPLGWAVDQIVLIEHARGHAESPERYRFDRFRSPTGRIPEEPKFEFHEFPKPKGTPWTGEVPAPAPKVDPMEFGRRYHELLELLAQVRCEFCLARVPGPAALTQHEREGCVELDLRIRWELTRQNYHDLEIGPGVVTRACRHCGERWPHRYRGKPLEVDVPRIHLWEAQHRCKEKNRDFLSSGVDNT